MEDFDSAFHIFDMITATLLDCMHQYIIHLDRIGNMCKERGGKEIRGVSGKNIFAAAFTEIFRLPRKVSKKHF